MNILRIYSLSFAALCALIATIALSQASPRAAHRPSALSGPDQQFVSAAMQAAVAETKMAELAKDRATSPDVREFALRVIVRDADAADQLKAMATIKGGQVAGRPSANDQATIARLNKLKGPAFDKAYLDAQRAAQGREVLLFQSEVENGVDDDLKQFASSSLPTLEGHLEMVEELSQDAGDVILRPSNPGVDLREA
jgi:putative membrane protein